jgi:hypothetical protein
MCFKAWFVFNTYEPHCKCCCCIFLDKQCADCQCIKPNNRFVTSKLIHVATEAVKLNSSVTFDGTFLCFAGALVANNCCSSSESTPRTKPVGKTAEKGNHGQSMRGEGFISFLQHCNLCTTVWMLVLIFEPINTSFMHNSEVRLKCSSCG